MNRYELHGPKLTAQGYDITPLDGKKPILPGWQKRPDTAKNYKRYSKAGIGVVLGGKHNIIAVDIDVLDEAAAKQIKALAVDILGQAPERIGKSPKTMLIYTSSAAMTKQRTATYTVGGQDACCEILAEGQQFVASGIHPDTKLPYKWPDDNLLDYAADELPTVDPDAITEFLAAANTVLSDCGEIKARTLFDSGANGAGNSKYDFATSPQQAEYTRILAALAYIPNDELQYDDWAVIAHAIKGALGDNIPAVELFHTFSSKASKYIEAETDRMWQSIGVVNKIGAGTIFHMASQNGYQMEQDNFGPNDLVQVSPDKHEEDEFPEAATEAATEAPEATPQPQVDANEDFTADTVHAPIAERQWVIKDWVPLKTVMMLFGAGGVGKTLLGQQAANCVATGTDFMGLETMQMPVLSISCEDDKLELSRRQLDINEWMGDAFADGPSNLTLSPRVGKDNILVTFPSQGEAKAGEFFKILCEKIEKARGDADSILVILDTAADLFGGNENVRREVNTFIKTFLGSIVQKYNATIILLAHPSLSGISSGSGLSGSTGWENSVRSRAYLSRNEDDPSIRTLSRMKSNYSDIGAENNITLIWEKGVLIMPTSSEHMDIITNRNMKHDIMAQVDIAWNDRNPIRAQGLRGYKKVIPATLPQHKKGAVVKAFVDLVTDGNIIHLEKKGYKTEKAI